MTPIQRMAEAAHRHPQFVAQLESLSYVEREERVAALKKALIETGREQLLDDLLLVNSYVEMQNLPKLVKP